jgi:hypothetical protein
VEYNTRAGKFGLADAGQSRQQRVHNLETGILKTQHDWVKTLEELWSRQLDSIKERSEERVQEKNESPPLSNHAKDNHEDSHS